MALARVKIMMENAPAPGSTGAKVDFNTMKAPAGCGAVAWKYWIRKDSLLGSPCSCWQVAYAFRMSRCRYVPGLGRGASGFMTRSDVGPAKVALAETGPDAVREAFVMPLV